MPEDDLSPARLQVTNILLKPILDKEKWQSLYESWIICDQVNCPQL